MKDPYVYKNRVLINKFDIDDSEKLKEMEVKIVAWKFLKYRENSRRKRL